MKHALALAVFLLAALLAPASYAQREPIPTSEITGTVNGFDTDQSILDVNTRVGRRLYLITNTTLVLLNNHSSTTANIQPGDEVTISYYYPTSEAVIVQLFRETRLRGTVRTVTGTNLDFRLTRRSAVTLRTDALSEIEIEGIRVTNNAVLAGLEATALVEPGTLLVIGLNVHANGAQAKVTLVDTTAGTITIGGRKPRTFTVDPNATLRRDGATATLADLVVGDQVKIAFVKKSGSLRALAVQARSGGASP